jgi:general secretion pathway protein D
MHRKGYGRVLARPKLLVNDNQEGTIKTEEKTSIVREETKIIPGTAATAPTATTSVGFQSFTAGIALTITPHISKGDQLQLIITLNRTDFRLRDDYVITSGDMKKEGPTPPDLLTSDVTTTITVPDSTTIILGGLERISQSKGGTKVPILGDIPFIGGLFRTTSNRDDQNRLYVFVKANIIRPGEEMTGESDIEIVSAKNRATFEKYEAEMQRYEDWPGIKPKPMDPVRILEAD